MNARDLREFFTTNTWWGKALGGFFGFLIGGSAGAFFGVLVGNFFDKGFSNYFSNPHLSYHLEQRKAVQKIFFEATFSIMGHIAKADGRVTEQEIEMARVLMKEMRLNREQKALAKTLYTQGKSLDFNLVPIIQNLKNTCKDNRELLRLFIDIQYRAAQVDGLSAKKIEALNSILAILGFAPLNQQYRFHEDFSYNPFEKEEQSYQKTSSSYERNPYHSPTSSIDHAYALLELNPRASKTEVKRAYRRSMSRNHPDKLIAQGLPEAMIKLANDKTQKILQAYEMICKNRGW
ncbi:MAG: co-chaperone DjlA [Legionellales bacterium]